MTALWVFSCSAFIAISSTLDGTILTFMTCDFHDSRG